MELEPESTSRCMYFSGYDFGIAIIRIDEQADYWRRHKFVEQFEPFGRELHIQQAHTREIATGTVQAGNESCLHRVGPHLEDDRDRRSRRFCCDCRRSGDRNNHSHLSANKVSRQCGQAIVAALRPEIFDRHIAALDVTDIVKALTEGSDPRRVRFGRRATEEPYYRQCLLLGAERGRCRHRTGQQEHEFATFHSITSSARTRIDGGTVMPSALAVLRLTTSSNVVGCCTGRSAGLAPLSMFPA